MSSGLAVHDHQRDRSWGYWQNLGLELRVDPQLFGDQIAAIVYDSEDFEAEPERMTHAVLRDILRAAADELREDPSAWTLERGAQALLSDLDELVAQLDARDGTREVSLVHE